MGIRLFTNVISIYLLVNFTFVQAESDFEYKYTLSVASVFKDEAPYLREWIEYNLLLGVEHFFLYNNDSTDDFLEVLEPYIAEGVVTLINWPSNKNKLGKGEWVFNTQWPALRHAISSNVGVSEWLAIIDIDEFILPLEKDTITSFLEDYQDYVGILVNWQCFGTSNIEEIPEDKLMIEALTHKSLALSCWNIAVKTILKPHHVNLSNYNWPPHVWFFKGKNKESLFTNKQKFQLGKIVPDKIVINHYVHRSKKYFREHKIAKKKRMEGVGYKSSYIRDWHDSCNLVEDFTIFKHVPKLREKIFN